jgi:hypothetical protein
VIYQTNKNPLITADLQSMVSCIAAMLHSFNQNLNGFSALIRNAITKIIS